MSRYEMTTPPPEPVPFKGTHRFPCKWCGDTLHVTDGLVQVHECSVYHSTNEHFGYVAEQIRIHEGMPSAQERCDSMRTEAAAVLVQFEGREPMHWPAATIDVESASEDQAALTVTRDPEPTCTCHWVDPKYWTTHYGAVEPGSMMEPNPDCPQHFPVGDALTITEFLLARLAEDEAAALEADAIMAEDFGATEVSSLHSQLDLVDPGHDNPPEILIDSTRVLAECAAKRAIIEDWEDPTDGGPWVADVDAGHVLATDRAARALAAVYKDHKDYRQEWAA